MLYDNILEKLNSSETEKCLGACSRKKSGSYFNYPFNIAINIKLGKRKR
jgi:hypothetical protein